MVAARQGNMKHKNPNNKGGNLRKSFKQGPQLQQQRHQGGGFKHQLMQQRNVGRPNMGAMFNQNPIMDNPNQMMDNPGYMDFNEPPVRQPYQQKGLGNKNQQQNGGNLGNSLNAGTSVGNGNANGKGKNRGRRIGMKQRGGNMQRAVNQRNVGNNLGNKSNANGRWSGQQRNNQTGNFGNGGQFRNGPPRMHPMQPPMGPMHPGDFDYGPQFFGPQRFGPGPMMPPPQMGMGMMGPPIGRGPMMPRRPIPPGMGAGPLTPFRGGNAGGRVDPMRRKGNQQNRRANVKGGKNKKKPERKGGKKQNVNAEKYPLDKPWITDEIKAAHEKKVELSNQLKGKKDDELFAEFKKQRDAFVTLYETARTEYNAKNKSEDVEKNESSDKTKQDENATNATSESADATATTTTTTPTSNDTNATNSNDGGGKNVVAQETANDKLD